MAQATLQIAGDSEKAQSAIIALEKKIDKLEGKLKGTAQRIKDAGLIAQKSFSNRAATSVMHFAASFVSLSAVIGAATKALQYHEQIKQESAQKQRQAQAGLASLSQLASTPEQLQDLVNQSRAAFGKGVGKNVDEAGNLIFSLESAGIKGLDRQLFVDLAANSVVADAAMFAQSSQTLQDAIGVKESGDFTAITSKAFAASSASPSTADELLNAAASRGTAGIASRLGISDEELLAAVATVASPAGGADAGGTQINALLTVLEKKGGFEGKSLKDSLEQIKGMGLEGSDLVEFFGRKEGLAGFDSLLKNMEKYESVVADIKLAESESRVNQRIALPGSVAEIAAAQAVQAEENQLENQRVVKGTRKNLIDAMTSELVAAAEERHGTLGGLFQNMEMGLSKILLPDEETLSDRGKLDIIKGRDPKLYNDIIGTLNRSEETDLNRRAGFVDALPAARSQIDEANRLAREQIQLTRELVKRTEKPERKLKRNE